LTRANQQKLALLFGEKRSQRLIADLEAELHGEKSAKDAIEPVLKLGWAAIASFSAASCTRSFITADSGTSFKRSSSQPIAVHAPKSGYIPHHLSPRLSQLLWHGAP
jgi:hypothetical protein